MSSILPGYQYDVFISYRQKDNKYDGWVTEFVDHLMSELESTFKDDVSVYFDINPHDGLLETHDVDASLKEKLKCLVFIPILSRTYCDPRAFAWDHELKAFVEQASTDQFGLKIKLPGGNVASRVLPVRIHDLDSSDIKLCESIFGGVLRSVDFIYKYSGVNRPLRSKEDNPHDNLNHTIYRDQINKVALAVKDIIEGIKAPAAPCIPIDEGSPVKEIALKELKTLNQPVAEKESKPEQKDPGEENLAPVPKKFFQKIPVLVITVILLIVCGFSVRFYIKQLHQNYARTKLIPQIQKLVEENNYPPFRASELALEAEKYIPEDSALKSLLPRVFNTSTLYTQPAGARVYVKEYDNPGKPWQFLGTTPLQNFRVPNGFKRIQIEKEGYQTCLLRSLSLIGPGPERTLKLDSAGTLPDNMVRIPSSVASMNIIGIESYKGKGVGEFLVDRFEVTNKDYKRFMDAGGYTNRIYWKYPICIDGKEISWESAMNKFVDKTGLKGPANWVVGGFPDGEGNHPVTGVSWYEACAYAFFAKKQLPTVYHWSVISETGLAMLIIPMSNFSGNGTVPVDSTEGISTWGIYDLAGNAREWCSNSNGVTGESYILGGGWNDPSYAFNCAFTQPKLDRSLSNGFRCMMNLPGDTTLISLSGPVVRSFRDYSVEKPVDDQTFELYLRQFIYDKAPLNPQGEVIEDPGPIKIEKIIIDAGYNKERFDIYLFIPKNAKPPYQPIIYWPGSGVISPTDFKPLTATWGTQLIVTNGRVLVFPILKGTYNRWDGLDSDLQKETAFYKDHVIMWRKDIGRTIDYLETRQDIRSDKVGYLGWSWGGFMGGLIPAVEKRIKAVVLNVGGMEMERAYPEVDQLNFLPRVHQPVLMLNGRYDSFFPEKTSQEPMYSYLGTPKKDKKKICYESGHLVPLHEFYRETLAWFDKYLGPVK